MTPIPTVSPLVVLAECLIVSAALGVATFALWKLLNPYTGRDPL
jgi:hypothetical protein